MKYSLLLLLSASTLLASIGEVKALRGEAQLIRGDTVAAVKKGTELELHDRIKTGEGSKLQIVFNDKTVISLGQKSDFSVDDYLFTKKEVRARFTIKKGFFKSITGKIGKIAPKHFKVKTANATIGVRGTTIVGETSAKMDIIACTYGQIEVASRHGSVIVNAGERTVVRENMPPREAQKVNRVLLKALEKKSDPVAPVEAVERDIPKSLPVSIKEETVEEKKEQKLQHSEEQKKQMVDIIQKEPSLDDIQKVVGSATPTYRGKVVEGSTTYGSIKQNGANEVRLDFDLGAGSMQGNMRFQDDVQNYDIDVAGRVKADGSFRFNSQNGYDGGGEGSLHAEAYKHADGSFDFQERDIHTKLPINNIKGRFETERE
jgi:hypothetical protein